jgi:hypothetical protein
MDSKKSVETVKELLQKCLDLYNESRDAEEYGAITFDYAFGPIEIINETNVKSILETIEFYDDRKEFTKKNLIGKIAIHSDGDNSIPWSIQEWIENTFNAKRFHLG